MMQRRALLAATNSQATGIATSGLVLHLDAGNAASYPGSGTTWTDLSGNGNNGTLINGPTYSSANGGVILFDGSNDYVAGSIPTLDTWTMSCWYLSNNITSALVFYPFSGTNVPNSGIGFGGTFDVNTQNKWYFFDSVTSFNASSTAIIVDTWYNLTVTKSSTVYNLYTNGVLSVSGSGLDLSLTQYNLGRRGNAVWYANGRIAQSLIYNKALSASEVSQNFNALRGRFGL